MIFVLLLLFPMVLLGQAPSIHIPGTPFGRDMPCLDPRRAIGEYIQHTWQAEQGLPQNSIYALCRTRDGYLWAGTAEGLVRFDGVSFTVFDKKNTPIITNNFIGALVEDRDGTLWIGSRGGGLYCLREGVFSKITAKEGLSHDVVGALLLDADGSLWIGTLGGGLNHRVNGKITTYSTQNGLSHNMVYALTQDRSGAVWAGTVGGGVNRIWKDSIRTYTSKNGLNSDVVFALLEDSDGAMLIGTGGGGVNRLKDGVFTTWTTKNGLSGNTIGSMIKERNGVVWIGTEGGLNRLHNGSIASYTLKDGLGVSLCYSLLADNEGILWGGTNRGIHNFQNTLFRNPISVVNEDISCIIQKRSSSNSFWIGSFGRIILASNGVVNRLTEKAGFPKSFGYSLLQANDGALWMGTIGAGAFRYDNGKLTRFSNEQGLSHNLIFSLFQTRDSTVWFGTGGGGLYRLHNGKFTRFTVENGLKSNTIRTMLQDSDGALWIGTEGGGVSKFSNGVFTTFTTQNGLSGDEVRSLLQDEHGAIWVGTMGAGLSRLKNGTITRVTTANGLFDDTALSMVEDDFGYIWITCYKGIYRVSKTALNECADGKRKTLRCDAFGTTEGMKSAECSSNGGPTSLKDSEGNLWFATIKGVVVVDPKNIVTNPIAPTVIIEDVKIDTLTLSPVAAQTVPPSIEKIEFHYTATTLLAPEKIKFKYMLEGYDNAWVEAGIRRTAYYTNLPHGRQYRFRVCACNKDGVWNEIGATTTLYLTPYFWETLWFLALLAVVLIGGVIAVTSVLSRRRLDARVQELEREQGIERERERERNRLSADLHDEIGSGLTQISMLSDVMKSHVPDNAPLRGHIETISATAQDVVRSVGNIVWALNPENDTLGNFLAYTREYAGGYFAGTGITVRSAFPNLLADEIAECHVTATFRRNMFLVVKEALANIVKHAAESRVVKFEVEFDATLKTLHLRIADDGGGMATTEGREFGNGLKTMRRRVEDMGGEFWITSAEGQGTEIRCRVGV